MKIEVDDSYTCFLGAPSPNYKGTDLVFVLKNIIFEICLIDLIELAVIKNIAINDFISFCNKCKNVIKSNHDNSDALTITNRCRDYLYYYI
jgi:hypothetical protein